MTMINLKDFYPWYIHDEYIEVSQDVANELQADKLYEMAYQRRIVRNRAHFSLNCGDEIEYSACLFAPGPQELLELKELFCCLCTAHSSLSEIQERRVNACVILGKSYREVAMIEGVSKTAIQESVQCGLSIMREKLKKSCKIPCQSSYFCPWYMREASYHLMTEWRQLQWSLTGKYTMNYSAKSK